MKLNLLPTSVSKGAGARTGIIFAIIVVAIAVFASATLKKNAQDELTYQTDRVQAYTNDAQKAKDVADEADKIIANAQGPLLNVKLAQAMDAHNTVYPDFYDRIKPFIPSYFRITSLQATPVDANTATVTINGVIGSFQQYANLMLALLRMPGAQAVSRNGYQLQDLYVPNLILEDQKAQKIMPGRPRVPEDPIQRLDLKIAQVQPQGFTGVGGFGTLGEPKVRGAMPEENAIVVAIVVTQNLLTPDPRATISGSAAAFTAAAATLATQRQQPPAQAAPAAAPAPGAK